MTTESRIGLVYLGDNGFETIYGICKEATMKIVMENKEVHEIDLIKTPIKDFAIHHRLKEKEGKNNHDDF